MAPPQPSVDGTNADDTTTQRETTQQQPQATQPQAQEYRFIYKDREYDCTEYARKHPGGELFFERMADEKKDFTEYFRTLHSKRALKILKSQPVVGRVAESVNSKQYTEIKKKVKPYMQPIWTIEIILLVVLSAAFILGITDSVWWRAIPTLTLVQIVSGWVAHSQNHNRNFRLWKMSTSTGLISGLGTAWWQFKHNNHHMFTNRIGKDDDINHNYKQWQYCFMFIKWKIDSIIVGHSKPEIVFLVIHWLLLLQQKLYITLPAMLFAGWFSANILVGNHEREHKFFQRIDKPFFEHQIIATRNYNFTDYISLVLMGGMQYQTEHHLFPQIPFYRLPSASKIIREELKKIGLEIKIDKIF